MHVAPGEHIHCEQLQPLTRHYGDWEQVLISRKHVQYFYWLVTRTARYKREPAIFYERLIKGFSVL